MATMNGIECGCNRVTGYVILGLLCSVVFVGCNRAAWQAAAQGAVAASAPPTPTALLLFGGQDHRAFLGCLNCSEMTQSSIFNTFSYGSSYGQTIFNHYSNYGSAYSTWSACNPYATDPPVMVDSAGHYYGRLTLNQYHTEIGTGRNYVEWLKEKVCS
jgi:hypothetical protein